MASQAKTSFAFVDLQTMDRGYRAKFTAMANPCELLIETQDYRLANEVATLAAGEALRIERKYSRYRDDGIVSTINRANGKSISLDDETAQLIDFSTALWRLSESAFDITSGVLRHIWKFTEPTSVPTADAVAAMLERVGWHRVTWRRPILHLPATMEIDLGGVGKEYAVDRAVMLIESLTDVPVLVNFGGDLRTAGQRPMSGSWQVGIESIAQHGRAQNLIKLESGALATSGDTRRCIEIGGQRFGHIIDARTGWPTQNAPRSITVAADTCSQAGSLTTLAMLQGNNAESFLSSQGIRHWCLR